MVLFLKILKMVKHFRKYFFELLGSYYSYINAIMPFRKYFFEIIFGGFLKF